MKYLIVLTIAFLSLQVKAQTITDTSLAYRKELSKQLQVVFDRVGMPPTHFIVRRIDTLKVYKSGVRVLIINKYYQAITLRKQDSFEGKVRNVKYL